MKIFIMLFIISSIIICSQSDTLVSQPEDKEDFLPGIPNENLMYDYLENENNLTIHMRTRYLSNPSLSPKIYNKFQGEYSKAYAGIITEKDAGEDALTNFYSYYAGYKDTGFIQNIIAGNYLVFFGSGLVTGNSYNSYKTSDPFFPITKNTTSISPYRSTDENKFYRGGAFRLKLNNFFITGFYSNIKGTVGLSALNGTKGGGLITEYHHKICIISFLAARYNIYEKFNSSDIKKDNTYLSFFAKVSLNKDISLQSETASDFLYSSNLSLVTIRASKQLSFVSSIRTYNRKFHSFYGSAFGEQYGSDYNERGFYNGFRVSIKGFSIDLLYDQFSLSGARDYKGSEFLIKGTYTFSKASNLKLKYRSRLKEFTDDPMYDKKSFSAEYILPLSGYFIYKVKGEYAKSGAKEEGYMFYNEIKYRKDNFKAEFRLTTFNTMSFETALYVFEQDMPGLFTSRILSGEGIRWYLCSSWKALTNLRISLKYSSVNKGSESVNYLGLQSDLEI